MTPRKLRTLQAALLGVTLAVGAGQAWAVEANQQPAADPMAPAAEKADKPRKADKADKADKPKGERPPGFREEMRKRAHEQLFKGIELSEEQKAKVKEVMEKGRAEAKAWKEAHAEEMQSLRTRFREARESGDAEAIKSAKEALATLMKDAPRPERHTEALKAILTEEQAKQFDANVAAMREMRKEMGQRRGPGGPPGERKPGGDGDKPEKKVDKKDRPKPEGDKPLDI